MYNTILVLGLLMILLAIIFQLFADLQDYIDYAIITLIGFVLFQMPILAHFLKIKPLIKIGGESLIYKLFRFQLAGEDFPKRS